MQKHEPHAPRRRQAPRNSDAGVSAASHAQSLATAEEIEALLPRDVSIAVEVLRIVGERRGFVVSLGC